MSTEFTITRRVQFAETDMAGVMHFANYFRWMEEVEHAFFRSLGMHVFQKHEGETISWPRVHVSCEYFGSVRFENEVEIRLNVTEIGTKSVTYEAVFSHDGERSALGRVKMVCCRMKKQSFESIPIPDSIRSRFESGSA